MWPFKKKTRTFFVAFSYARQEEKDIKEYHGNCIATMTPFTNAGAVLSVLAERLEKEGCTKIIWTAFNEIPSE